VSLKILTRKVRAKSNVKIIIAISELMTAALDNDETTRNNEATTAKKDISDGNMPAHENIKTKDRAQTPK
jgi:hypothetical protein